jgi:replicative DNA helicase
VNQNAASKNRSSKDIATPSLKQDQSCQLGQTSSMIKIGSMDVIIDDQVNQKTLDHEIRSKSLASEYIQMRWCPLGLSHTQKRRLQRHRNQESKEKEMKPLKEVNKKKEVPVRPLSSIKKE